MKKIRLFAVAGVFAISGYVARKPKVTYVKNCDIKQVCTIKKLVASND